MGRRGVSCAADRNQLLLFRQRSQTFARTFKIATGRRDSRSSNIGGAQITTRALYVGRGSGDHGAGGVVRARKSAAGGSQFFADGAARAGAGCRRDHGLLSGVKRADVAGV